MRWSVGPLVTLELKTRKTRSLFIFYKNVIFFLKPLKEIEIATSKITTMFLIFERFKGLMFL